MADSAYQTFEAALAQFIQQEMPWPYRDVSRDSGEASDAAWAVAKVEGPRLWAAVKPESVKGEA
jgi:hypothetical protein